jgi:hypothetical protein
MRKEIIFTVLLAGTAVLIQGCFAAVVGAGAAGTVAYVRGDLEAVEPYKLNTVYAATKKAVNQLGYAVTKDAKDATAAEIIARDVKDKKITIKLDSTTEGVTKLSIRVGVFGDETWSTLIYRKIEDNLKSNRRR